jgi:hypothetical protein
LATLGDTIKNRNNPIFCHTAQEQLLLSLVAVAGVITLDFANVNTALMMKEKKSFCFQLDHDAADTQI